MNQRSRNQRSKRKIRPRNQRSNRKVRSRNQRSNKKRRSIQYKKRAKNYKKTQRITGGLFSFNLFNKYDRLLDNVQSDSRKLIKKRDKWLAIAGLELMTDYDREYSATELDSSAEIKDVLSELAVVGGMYGDELTHTQLLLDELREFYSSISSNFLDVVDKLEFMDESENEIFIKLEDTFNHITLSVPQVLYSALDPAEVAPSAYIYKNARTNLELHKLRMGFKGMTSLVELMTKCLKGIKSSLMAAYKTRKSDETKAHLVDVLEEARRQFAKGEYNKKNFTSLLKSQGTFNHGSSASSLIWDRGDLDDDDGDVKRTNMFSGR